MTIGVIDMTIGVIDMTIGVIDMTIHKLFPSRDCSVIVETIHRSCFPYFVTQAHSASKIRAVFLKCQKRNKTTQWWTIRLFNGCDVWIENSVMRVTVEWCWTVIPSDWIFNLHLTTIMDSFSCILFLPHLHLNFLCIILSILPWNIYIFVKKCLVRLLLKILMSKHLAENEAKYWS